MFSFDKIQTRGWILHDNNAYLLIPVHKIGTSASRVCVLLLNTFYCSGIKENGKFGKPLHGFVDSRGATVTEGMSVYDLA